MRCLTLTPQVQRWLRFVVGGGINTGFSYLLYLLASLILSYQVAFLLRILQVYFFLLV